MLLHVFDQFQASEAYVVFLINCWPLSRYFIALDLKVRVQRSVNYRRQRAKCLPFD